MQPGRASAERNKGALLARSQPTRAGGGRCVPHSPPPADSPNQPRSGLPLRAQPPWREGAAMVGRPPHSAEDAARTTRTTGHGRGLQGPEGRHVPGAKGTVLSSACKRCWASSRGLQLALGIRGPGAGQASGRPAGPRLPWLPGPSSAAGALSLWSR